METRASLVAEKKRKKREKQVREHVITLVKYLDTVIHDIKYVVGDLQILLEQIDLVSRQLDQSTQPSFLGDGTLGRSEEHARCVCSQSQVPGKLLNPLLARAKRVSSGSKKTKRSNKSRRLIHEDSSSASSLGSWDKPRQGNNDNVMDSDTVSVELNAMWDNAFDNELLATSWTDQTNGSFDYLANDQEVQCSDTEQDALTKRSSWFSGAKLEQSLTSGIEMLSFTDDSEEEFLSSALPNYKTNYLNVSKENVVNIDPYHVCCKEVIPLGSDHGYCGVYEAILDASLESYSCMVESESFGSDVGLPLFCDEHDMEDETTVTYEPMYDTQLNTWTAYTMVALDSPHTSEEELSETVLDILNDNIPSSAPLDNINTGYTNTETICTENGTGRITTNTDDQISTNTYIISC